MTFKNPTTNYVEVEEKLLSLNLPTLFLQKINHIKWKSCENNGEYNCSILKNDSFNGINYYLKEFTHDTNRGKNSLKIHLFADKTFSKTYPLQIAFLSSSTEKPITHDSTQNCYCFFETKCNSGLNFLIHAPFALTSNREGIKEGNDWNKLLQVNLAKLIGLSLEYLCKKEKLGDDLIEFLPLKTEKKKDSQNHPFQLLHDELLKMTKTLRVFRTQSGKYSTAEETLYTESDEIKQLFNSEQLRDLNNTYTDWCFCSISNKDTIATLTFNQLIAKHVTFLELIKHITPNFLKKQSLEWLTQLYIVANKFTECWLGKNTPFKTQALLLGCDNEFHSLYFEDSDTPRLYLSSGISNKFEAIHPELLNNEKCKHFFKNLGITEPGKLAEILLYILPRYQNFEIGIDKEITIGTDITDIIDCYESLSPFREERKQLVEQLQTTPLFPAFTISKERTLKRACECCIESPNLKSFLSHNDQFYFLDSNFISLYIAPEKREKFYQILSELGLCFGLRIEEKQISPSSITLEKLSLKPNSLRQYDKGAQIIKDKEIVGFESFLSHLTPKSSAAFYNLLKDEIERQSSYLFRLSLQGDYQYIEKGKKHYTQEIISSTSAIQSIFRCQWMYNKNGEKCSPQEINSSADLSEIYDISATDLLFFLGIKLSAEISNLTQSQREAIAIVNKFKSHGISISMMEKILTEIIEKKR